MAIILTPMEPPLSVPAAYDKYNLRSVFICTQCKAYIGPRPVTTRCGHSFCQKCVLKGKCPIDACRQYSAKDCPHDIKLGRLLEEIEKVINTASQQGVWKKRNRIADSPIDDYHYVPPLPRQHNDTSRRASLLRYLPFHYKRFQPASSTNTVLACEVDRPCDTPHETDNTGNSNYQEGNNVLSHLEGGPKETAETVSGAKSFTDSVSETSETMTTSIADSMDHEASSNNDLSYLLATRVLDGFNCDICCHCFLEPMTLRCGHTYCRECLHRCLDEKSFRTDLPDYRIVKPTCPLCRQQLGSLLPVGEAMHHDYTWNWTPNRSLQKLINTCWVPQLEESKKHNSEMTKLVPDGMDIPLFVCTISLPTQPTHLQIFEPRYRTMLRRVLRSTDKTFGMTVHDRLNPARPFAEIGVLLQVESVHYVQPGATASPPSDDVVMLVQTRGVGRFVAKDWQQYHGYWTVKGEPLYDQPDWESDHQSSVTVAESGVTEKGTSPAGYDPKKINLSWFLKALASDKDITSKLKTQEIVTVLHEIINKRKRTLRRDFWDRITSAHGTPPDNPSDLSWWLAGVFIRDNVVRMSLLAMTNPRERLQCLLTTIAQALA